MIPPGLALALWAWRRPTGALRARLVMVVAGVAALASIASASSAGRGGRFREESVETPRGVSTVEGTEVSHDGEVVYSMQHLQDKASIWLQFRDTRHLDARIITTRPYGIKFDNQTGNVLVGMGRQGVLVGTPDGQWTLRAQGRYRPTDLSRGARARALLTTPPFWALALALAGSTCVIAILIKDFRRDRLEMVALGLLLIVPVALLWLLSLLVVLVLAVQIGVASSVAFGIPAEVALLALPLWVLAFPAGLMARFRGSRTKREALQYALGVPSLDGGRSTHGVRGAGSRPLSNSRHDRGPS